MIAHNLRTSTVIHPKHALILAGCVATHRLYCLLTKFLLGFQMLAVPLQRLFSFFKTRFFFKQLLENLVFYPPAKYPVS